MVLRKIFRQLYICIYIYLYLYIYIYIYVPLLVLLYKFKDYFIVGILNIISSLLPNRQNQATAVIITEAIERYC